VVEPNWSKIDYNKHFSNLQYIGYDIKTKNFATYKMNPQIPKPVIWSVKQDIENHSWDEWLAARIYSVCPLHHYGGSIHISEAGSVVLEGKRIDSGENVRIVIKKNEILSAQVGFDNSFKRRYDRDFGLTFQPLILTTSIKGDMETYYLGIELDHLFRFTNNQVWCDVINNKSN
jgi:hypothetical protein